MKLPPVASDSPQPVDAPPPHEVGSTPDESARLMREAAEATGPGPAVRRAGPLLLEYGRREPVYRRMERAMAALLDALGGWRQIYLAVGVGLMLFGVATAIWPRPDPAGFISVGGFIVTLALPLRLNRGADLRADGGERR